MQFIVLLRATKDTEAGAPPTTELLEQMGAYNEALVNAGVMRGGEGIQPTSKGARVRFSGADRTVEQGPFHDLDRLISGFWLWECASKEEAIEWVKKCPNPTGDTAEIEVRQLFTAEDFAEADPTGELRAKEAALRARVEG